jgi:hypothetical protein
MRSRQRASLALLICAVSFCLAAPAHAEDALPLDLGGQVEEISSTVEEALTDLTQPLAPEPEELLETEPAARPADAAGPDAPAEEPVGAVDAAASDDSDSRMADQGEQYQIEPEQYHPANINVSVRVLSPGDNGQVSQQNAAGPSAGPESAPANTNVSVRILSPGNDGSVGQANGSPDGLANAAPDTIPQASPTGSAELEGAIEPTDTSEWTWIWDWGWAEADIAGIDSGALSAEAPAQYHGNDQQYQPQIVRISPLEVSNEIADKVRVKLEQDTEGNSQQKFVWNWIWNWNWNRPPASAFDTGSSAAEPQGALPSLPAADPHTDPPATDAEDVAEESDAWGSWIWDELVTVDGLATRLASAAGPQREGWGLWFAGMPPELADVGAITEGAIVSIAPPESAVPPGGISPARPKCSTPSCRPDAPGLPRAANVAAAPALPAAVERREVGADAATAAPAGPLRRATRTDPESFLQSLPLQPTGSPVGSQGASASPPALFFGGLVAALAALVSLATPGLLRAVSVSSCVRRAKALVLPLERPG